MPRQGGQGKGKPKKKDRDFGKALIRQQSQGSHGFLGTKMETNHKNLSSILEVNALDDYIDLVEMDDIDVEVKRYESVEQESPIIIQKSVIVRTQELSDETFSQEQLSIPRKPNWTYSMSADEVDRNEKQAFMEWRRHIAEFEQRRSTKQRITPFEKNLEVWRQLWRVCERSNIVVQVVDARNPLLFYTSDLKKYLCELNPPRRMVILVNKSDLLTNTQRIAWTNYFNSEDIKHLFYSAFIEQQKLDDPGSVHESGVYNIEHISQYLFTEQMDSPLRDGDVLTRKQLMELFHFIEETFERDRVKPFCVGMVGYPNVGKSSCINTLLGVTKSNHGKVRVGVSATPGKTKHFQTIPLSRDVVLCDCPGLVFASFMRSAGEMLCSGILPINQMRDCIDPADIICARIPRHILEATYGIRINRELDVLDNPHRPPTGTELLAAYCRTKGYITSGTGRWDDFRGCKEILRDFNDGKLLYVAKPPNDSTFSLDEWLLQTESTVMKYEKVADRVHKMRQTNPLEVLAEVEALECSDEKERSVSPCTYENISGETLQYETSDSNCTEQLKREHKRLKHWGKKNKKLRDKDPYGENHGTETFVINIRNRAPIGLSGISQINVISK